MKRRDFLTLSGLSAVTALLPWALASKTVQESTGLSSKASKPNIVLVLVDDVGWGELGCAGNTIVKTPNIDHFFSEAIRFTNCHVAPICAPTRAQLMSGRHEFYGGVTHNLDGREYLDRNITILPQVLKRAGYATGLFGKWHLGSERDDAQPQNRGFDEALWCATTTGYLNPGLRHNGSKERFRTLLKSANKPAGR